MVTCHFLFAFAFSLLIFYRSRLKIGWDSLSWGVITLIFTIIGKNRKIALDAGQQLDIFLFYTAA